MTIPNDAELKARLEELNKRFCQATNKNATPQEVLFYMICLFEAHEKADPNFIKNVIVIQKFKEDYNI